MARVASMTGFASATQGPLSVELKSVNGRFLELSLRLPDELRALEAPIREAVAARLARGKVDCRVNLNRDPLGGAPRLNPAALAQLGRLAQEIEAALPQARPIGVADVLRWPGVVDSPQADADTLREPLNQALAEAISALQQSRQREGSALHDSIAERCDRIDAIVAQVRLQVPAILAGIERKLQERMSQALAGALAGTGLGREEINERIRQELTLYGLRADVDEELARLGAHVAEVRRVLREGGAVGRRLDFLMQELNREANTVASKASAIEMTAAAVELKLLIEQMREQIQNLE
jgi:uncharacterized protein (TIGR00255 family)